MIERSHRGANATILKISHIPSVFISNLTIKNSSSLAFSSTYPSFLDEYGSAFAKTDLISNFNSSIIHAPGSLIDISSSLWLRMENI